MKQIKLNSFPKTPQIINLILWGVLSLGTIVSCKLDHESSDGKVIDNAKLGRGSAIKKNKTEQPKVADWTHYLPTSTTNQVVEHQFYTLSYNEEVEQAEWVAYELKSDYIINNDFKRPYFIEDPKVSTRSADWRNYKKSGYDKGHLCPAADMEFSLEAYNDTFYTSNISPQNHEFNGGIWNRLEQKVRYWAKKENGVIVITGGVLKNTSKTIGNQKVAVPDYFYKIVFEDEVGKQKMIAFLMPNEKSDKSLYEFVVSVDRIEKLTGIDFFPNLDDKIENKLEMNTDSKLWLSN
ncbi:DNA/RNA non-specific endonuclease [Flavobacterium algicola]|uniref:DNA/RNA non-specific endonuclease n=1 Tax=Flavobacterium algicola TaxID=556529 RepID=UPI001EFD3C6D|nr:DNA/RNA non-specific endonuclease [Flavobacterium algicola]MCG9794131.1 DNA/RNA non-specific endonuclease [Flavobacterium algicola]